MFKCTGNSKRCYLYLGFHLSSAAWCRALNPLLFVMVTSAPASRRTARMSSRFLLIASWRGVSPSRILFFFQSFKRFSLALLQLIIICKVNSYNDLLSKEKQKPYPTTSNKTCCVLDLFKMQARNTSLTIVKKFLVNLDEQYNKHAIVSKDNKNKDVSSNTIKILMR